MSLLFEIKKILQETLQLDDVLLWDENTELLGAVAEFDSMALVTFLTNIEENYGILIDDDEVSADIFETLGTLNVFLQEKVA